MKPMTDAEWAAFVRGYLTGGATTGVIARVTVVSHVGPVGPVYFSVTSLAANEPPGMSGCQNTR